MQLQQKAVTLPVDRLVTGETYLICTKCKRNHRLMKILPDTNGRHVLAYCRDCKSEIELDIVEGQCFESRSR